MPPTVLPLPTRAAQPTSITTILTARAARPSPRTRTAQHGAAPAPAQQTRHATLIKRPQRPYTFTQLLTLSDGSAVVHRTTSPQPVYRSTRDARNTALWNPSNAKIAAVEEDEAGRLRAFRRRFGRGWDAEGAGQGAAQGPGADGGAGALDARDAGVARAAAAPAAPTVEPGSADGAGPTTIADLAVGGDGGAGGAAGVDRRGGGGKRGKAAKPGAGPAAALGDGRTVNPHAPSGAGEVDAGRQVGRSKDGAREENLMDLVARYGRLAGEAGAAKGSNEPARPGAKGKAKGGQK